MGGPRLTNEQKLLARRLRHKGISQREIARQICCDETLVSVMFRHGRFDQGVEQQWSPRASRLSVHEREQILLGLARDESLSLIARSIGRAPSTVTREVANNGGRAGYSVWSAHCRARTETTRPKPAKLCRGPLLREVTKRLEQLWSPQEIAHRLRLDHPDDPAMHVSHETIYQSLYVQGRGELRRELARCLRTGRTKRQPHGTVEKRGKIANMVMIAERPAEVSDRSVPGHWEGDLIIGANHRSAVGTLVERTTRLLLLLHLPHGYGADEVESAMRKAIKTLPKELARSVTWDQGKEMANHADFTIATNIPVYFCDPHSPWQRGSNENTNGLLRQYLPKGMDLSTQSAADLRRIQRSLNERPRETLGYMTPLEKFTELVALTG
jgi:IS30 family transposase